MNLSECQFSEKRCKLLLPAGTHGAIQAAFLYGADAVYAGVPDMSLRTKTTITIDEMEESIKIAHNFGKEIYLAVNLFLRNADEKKLSGFTSLVRTLKPDGIIVSDAGVFDFFREATPDLPLHISTQANICSLRTAMFWHKLGARQVVLGREVTFSEIKEIIKNKPSSLAVEMFVHGAMCMSYSGRCLLSAFMASRSANAGACAHSCRWKYKTYAIEEEKRPGQFMPILEDDNGTYILNSKDLCLMPHLNEILSAGVDALKVEGRNKTEYYVACTARSYSAAIKEFYDTRNINTDMYVSELNKIQNRGYTEGFFNNDPKQNYCSTTSDSEWRAALLVSGHTSNGMTLIIKNGFLNGQQLEILSPKRFEPFVISAPQAMKITEQYVLPYDAFNKVLDDTSASNMQKLFPKWTVGRFKKQ
ncbi:MAG: U32 family peptidase [Termitinemataceae bacterium]|nr:MAG: U32 family peptidase [Termitinemataceae bacterium]